MRSRSRSGAVRFVGGAQVRLLEKSGLVRDLDVRELAAEELLALAFKARLVAFELAFRSLRPRACPAVPLLGNAQFVRRCGGIHSSRVRL